MSKKGNSCFSFMILEISFHCSGVGSTPAAEHENASRGIYVCSIMKVVDSVDAQLVCMPQCLSPEVVSMGPVLMLPTKGTGSLGAEKCM